MTRHNCDRCGVEIPAPEFTKAEFVGTMKYDPNSYSMIPRMTVFDLCQPCKAWVIKEATTYKGGHK